MQSMNISLPDPMKEFVDGQISSGRYSSVSEYMRELIREDEKRKAQDQLEKLLLEGLQGEATPLTADDLHVIRHNEFFQPRRNLFRQARFEIQKQFIREREDVQVAFHFALRGGDGGVATFTRAEFFHIVRYLSVQKPCAVGTDETDARTKT